MLFFRWLVLFLLLVAGVCFAVFIITGQVKYKAVGLKILKVTLVAAFGFFTVLILERVA
jgi:hypothetical protein